MSKRTVLLVGEDVCYLRMLAYALRCEGFCAEEREGGSADCAVVDLDSAAVPVGMPTVGYSRTGRTSPDCTVTLARPFAIPELVEALHDLDRPSPRTEQPTRGLLLDDNTRTAALGTVCLSLMPAEYALLRRLMRAEGEAVSRAELIEALPSGSQPSSNLAEVTVCTLRRKLENAFGIRPIRTVRGVGYRYDC